jgi:hydroxymethylbilane synthase
MAFRLRIGSRPSRLALTQAEFVRASLSALLPGLGTELVSIRTSGDRIMTPSLAGEGGKGLFIKELEQALSGRRADIAVHSMKDLPAVLSPAYRIAAVPERENPCDALVTRDATGIRSLPPGARLGTSSSRRRFEALKVNPALEVVPLRGNVDTRLQRVLSGELEATILAMAGLKRLGRLKEVRYEELDEREFVPAAAQAALAIETLGGNRARVMRPERPEKRVRDGRRARVSCRDRRLVRNPRRSEGHALRGHARAARHPLQPGRRARDGRRNPGARRVCQRSGWRRVGYKAG